MSDDVTPYGVIRNRHIWPLPQETALYAAPDADSEQLVTLAADSRLSIWQIEDGWTVVPYKRVVGYLYVGDITARNLSPQPDYAQMGDVISSSTFLFTAHFGAGSGAHGNIRVGCGYTISVNLASPCL